MLVHPQFDPVALAIGPLQIHWYGLTYLVAFGLLIWMAGRTVLEGLIQPPAFLHEETQWLLNVHILARGTSHHCVQAVPVVRC